MISSASVRDPGSPPARPAAAIRFLANIALAFSAIALTALVLEVALRLRARFEEVGGLGDVQARGGGALPPGSRARLGDIIRVSRNPRIVYELIPNLDVTFVNAPLITNREGFRGPERTAERRGPTVRLLGLGDSVMFGWGVSYENCFLARLERLLARDFPEVSWEAVNTAVPGYNTAMEVATLREKGLAYAPDVVVVNYVGNDLGLPSFIVDPRDSLSFRSSFLVEFVRSRLALGPAEPGRRLRAVPREVRRQVLSGRMESVPPRYRELVGLDAYRRSMSELKELSVQHAFSVVVLAQPIANDFVKELGAELGFPVVETESAVEQHLAGHAGGSDPRSELTVSAEDPHPSDLGHEIIASVLHRHLVASGLARKLVERASRGGR